MKSKNNGFGLGALVLLLLLTIKKKPKSVVIIEPVEPTVNLDADYLVMVAANTPLLYNDFKSPATYSTSNLTLDGFKIKEQPKFIKVKLANKFYYVEYPNYKILKTK